MKKSCFTFLMLIFGLLAYAQNISVADFYYVENDLTALTHGTSVEDQNGNICALIKVETTEKGLWTFDVGLMGVQDTEFQNAAHPAQIWVWVPYSVLFIEIQHDKLGMLRYNFPCSIDKGCTYIMKLTTGKVKTYIEEDTTEQWLVFEITPHDAILEVDDKMWPVSAEGTARKMMPFGTYNYHVQAQNYHPAVGKVTVNDPENSQVVPVNLEPNFGWIEVPGDNGLSGAVVYVDNALIGKAPCKSDALKSGQHNVRIMKEMYEPYSTTVTVSDNETVIVAPALTSDYARLTLQVDADAEIWVNDELKGTRAWTGDLRAGTYRIECKQQGHETTTTKKTVTSSMDGEVIVLQAPIPIYGSLNVECTPDLANLYIDGKETGKAPKLIGKILVGEHEIRLAKKGYNDYNETVTITQGQRTQVKATLTSDGSTPVPVVVKPQQPETPQTTTTKPEIKQPAAKKSINKVFFVMANAAYSIAPQTSFGLTVGSAKRFGWYASLSSNFKFKKAEYECDFEGNIDGLSSEYSYSGEKSTSRLGATVGAVFRIYDPLYAYVGAGYGFRNVYWQLADGTWAKCTDDSYQSVAIDAGLMLHFGGFGFSLGVQTIGVKYMEAKVGIGYTLKRR